MVSVSWKSAKEFYADFGACQCLWYYSNNNKGSKSKQFIYCEDWCDKDILYIDDLLNHPYPGARIYEQLISYNCDPLLQNLEQRVICDILNF